MKKLFEISFFILSLSILESCNFSKNADPLLIDVPKENPSVPGVVLSAKDLSYKKINEVIFKVKCLQCHSGKDEPNLSSYKDVLLNKEEIIEQAILSAKMPKNGRRLTDEERINLKTWLDSGAPEFSANESDNQPTTPVVAPILKFERPVKWSQIKTEILDKNCLACHATGNTDGISSYEDYETTKATIGTIFYTVSINPVMPPAPADLPEGAANPNQLTRDQKDLLSAWVTDGMQK